MEGTHAWPLRACAAPPAQQQLSAPQRQAPGAAAAQARAIVDGLPGDIVALALPLDVQKIADEGLIAADWQARTHLTRVCIERPGRVCSPWAAP